MAVYVCNKEHFRRVISLILLSRQAPVTKDHGLTRIKVHIVSNMLKKENLDHVEGFKSQNMGYF